MEGPGSGGAEPATRGDTAPLRAPRPGNVNDLGLGSAIMPTIKTDKSGGPLASAAVRPADAAASYGRRGDLEVRLASSPREIDAAQAIRYRVFYEEMSAIPDAETRASATPTVSTKSAITCWCSIMHWCRARTASCRRKIPKA